MSLELYIPLGRVWRQRRRKTLYRFLLWRQEKGNVFKALDTEHQDVTTETAFVSSGSQ